MTFNFYDTKVYQKVGEVQGKNKHGDDLNTEYTYADVWSDMYRFTCRDKLIVVDADALVYRVSAASDSRSIVVLSLIHI